VSEEDTPVAIESHVAPLSVECSRPVAEIRQRICEASAWLGVALDTQLNAGKGPRISTPQSKVSVWVIPTNEELMIHRHTATLLQLH